MFVYYVVVITDSVLLGYILFIYLFVFQQSELVIGVVFIQNG